MPCFLHLCPLFIYVALIFLAKKKSSLFANVIWDFLDVCITSDLEFY